MRVQQMLIRQMFIQRIYFQKFPSILINLFIFWGVSGCTLLFDPQNCTSDSECQGGRCQVGICVGPIIQDFQMGGTPLDEGMDLSAGEDLTLSDDLGGGFEVDEGMGGDVVDFEVSTDQFPIDAFECRFDRDHLIEQGGVFSDSQTVYMPLRSFTLHVYIVDPNTSEWESRRSLFLNEQALTLSELDDPSKWTTTLSVDHEGEHQLRMVIGSEFDVKCFTSLTLIVDESAPLLEPASPPSTVEWFGDLGSPPNAPVTLKVQDLSPVSLYLDEQLLTSEPMGNEWRVFVPLSVGENEKVFKAVDLLGHETDLPIRYSYDPIPPVIQMTQPTDLTLVTDRARFVIRGQVFTDQTQTEVEVNRIVDLEIQSLGDDQSPSEILSTLTSNSGQFEIEIRLSPGANRVDVCAFDQARNQGCERLSITYLYEPPCIHVSSPWYTSTQQTSITGEVCPSVVAVEAFVAPLNASPQDLEDIDRLTPFASATALEENRFSLPIDLDELGSNALLLVARTDQQDEAEQLLDFVFDSTPPQIQIVQPQDELCTNSFTLQLCGRMVDHESGIRDVRLNQNPFDLLAQGQTQDPNWWTDFCVDLNVQELTSPLILEGTNQAGLSAQDQVSFVVDQVAPSVRLNEEDGHWYGSDSRGLVAIEGTLNVVGCALSSQDGILLYLIQEYRDESGQLQTNREGPFRPQINPQDASFIYQTLFEHGEYELEVQVQDEGGNQRTVIHPFAVDRIPPQIDLLTPQVLLNQGQSETFEVRFEVQDEGSGIDLNQAQFNGQRIDLTLIEGSSPPRYQGIGQVDVAEGTHQVTLRIQDEVGLVSEIEFTYIRDLTPPVANVVIPQTGQAVHSFEQVWVDAFDDATDIDTVHVNGVQAFFDGLHWKAENVPFILPDLNLILEVYDRAGNELIRNYGDELQLNRSPFSLRSAQRSTLGSDLLVHLFEGDAGRQKNGLGGSFPNEGMNFFYGQWIEGQYSLLQWGTPTTQEQNQEEPITTLQSSWSLDQGWSVTSSSTLPPSTLMNRVSMASVENHLVLFTLSHQSPDPTQVSTSADPLVLQSWIYTAFGEWELIDLGLPNPLTAQDFTLQDVTGDGRIDLLLQDGDALLLFRQSESEDLSDCFQFDLLSRYGLDELTVGSIWMMDVNGDALPDLLQDQGDLTQGGEGIKLYLNQGGTPYSYLNSPSFPLESITVWMMVDWNQDGELDLIGQQNQMLYQYEWITESGNEQWIRTALNWTLPLGSRGLTLADVNGDSIQEIVVYGDFGLQAWNQNGRLYETELPDVGSVVDLIWGDFDSDGDEDGLLLIEDVNQEEHVYDMLWMLNYPQMSDENLSFIRLDLNRGVVGQWDALYSTVYTAPSNQFTFSYPRLLRPFTPNLIPLSSEELNLQIQFANRGGNYFSVQPNQPRQSTVSLSDEQGDE